MKYLNTKNLAFKLGVSSLAILPLTLAAVNLTAAPASAGAVIGGTGGPDLTIINGGLSDFPDNAVDNFQLTQGITTITDLHWWGFFAGTEAAQDNFFTSIFDNNSSGFPGTIVAEPIFVGPILKEVVDNSSGVTIYKYSVDIQPVTLSANTTYWLDVNNDTAGGNWFWSTHNSTGTHVDVNTTTGVAEIDNAGDLAFQLTSTTTTTVPEPAANLGFIALGILGAASTLKQKLNNSDEENGDKD